MLRSTNRELSFLCFGIPRLLFGAGEKISAYDDRFMNLFARSVWRMLCVSVLSSRRTEESVMKTTMMGYLVGAIFTIVIAAVAALDAFAAGGLVLLASVVAGLGAGLCIGGLIAANFALLAMEEKEKEEVVGHSPSAARAAA
jgi:hypothetical protein